MKIGKQIRFHALGLGIASACMSTQAFALEINSGHYEVKDVFQNAPPKALKSRTLFLGCASNELVKDPRFVVGLNSSDSNCKTSQLVKLGASSATFVLTCDGGASTMRGSSELRGQTVVTTLDGPVVNGTPGPTLRRVYEASRLGDCAK